MELYLSNLAKPMPLYITQSTAVITKAVCFNEKPLRYLLLILPSHYRSNKLELQCEVGFFLTLNYQTYNERVIWPGCF